MRRWHDVPHLDLKQRMSRPRTETVKRVRPSLNQADVRNEALQVHQVRL